jgi:hypothetical protein
VSLGRGAGAGAGRGGGQSDGLRTFDHRGGCLRVAHLGWLVAPYPTAQENQPATGLTELGRQASGPRMPGRIWGRSPPKPASTSRPRLGGTNAMLSAEEFFSSCARAWVGRMRNLESDFLFRQGAPAHGWEEYSDLTHGSLPVAPAHGWDEYLTAELPTAVGSRARVGVAVGEGCP